MTEQINKNRLGDAIRFQRKRAGLSQANLAKMSGVGNALIFNIEHGHTGVRLDAMAKILSVLNIKLELSGEFPESPIRLNDAKN